SRNHQRSQAGSRTLGPAAMAGGSEAAAELQEEATCAICLDLFRSPVMLDCGHNFCQACIGLCWARSAGAPSCPQCRQALPSRSLRPNRQLGNIAAGLRRLGQTVEPRQVRGSQGGLWSTPGTHFGARALSEPVWPGLGPCCVGLAQGGCGASSGDSQHPPGHPPALWGSARRRVWARRSPEVTSNLGHSGVRSAHSFLTHRLQIMILHLHASELCNLSAKALGHLHPIQLQQLAPNPPMPVAPVAGTWSLALAHSGQTLTKLVPSMVKLFPRTGLYPQCFDLTFSSAVNVTLDPDTAQSRLILSEDGKSVMQGATQQHRPDSTKRFDPWPCVLGCEGFDSGRPCWEVEVGSGSCWAVGVALESVRRKGPIDMNPVGGIWAVGQYKEKFQALTSPTPTPFLPSMVPRRVRVCLNHAEGRVTFVNADNEATIFTFLQATFSGKRIYPWFWIFSNHGTTTRNLLKCRNKLEELLFRDLQICSSAGIYGVAW
uniref:Uncharacterized protein n=1 Tax=Anas platyrhynchos TaxID=8839 RepID=A0A8B9TBM5_ANAPL